jgi:hypothetical protein
MAGAGVGPAAAAAQVRRLAFGTDIYMSDTVAFHRGLWVGGRVCMFCWLAGWHRCWACCYFPGNDAKCFGYYVVLLRCHRFCLGVCSVLPVSFACQLAVCEA